MRKIVVTWLLIAVACSCACAQNKERSAPVTSNQSKNHWMSWRGPRGTGTAINCNPPTHWAEQEGDTPQQNIAWKTRIPGLGISSPIVWQDRVYLTTAIETDRPGRPDAADGPQSPLAEPRKNTYFEFVVLAVNRKDGSIAWKKTVTEAVPHEGGHRTNSHASGSPTTDGTHIYVNFGSRGIYCLNLQGETVWNRQFGAMQTRRDYGEGSSPTLYGDSLIVNFDHEQSSFLVCLDKHTGETRWRQSRDEVTSWSTPIVTEVDGKPQVIINATSASRGYDFNSGEVIWSLTGMTVNCIPIPIVADGIAYVMSGYRGQMLQAVTLLGANGDLTGSSKLRWDHRRNTSYVPSATLHDNHLYFVRGNTAVLSCLDAKSGEVHFEGIRLPGLRTVYSSPVCASNRIYITSRDGVTAVINHGTTYQPITTNRINDEVDASPAIVGDAIYMRGRQHLYCLANDTSAEEAARPNIKQPDSDSSTRADDSPILASGSLGTRSDRTASLSIGDIDGDGDMDFVVANGRHWPGQNRVFLNNGQGIFDQQHNLSPLECKSYATALGDLDGDGDLDVLVGNDRQPSYLMINDGRGHFTKGHQVGKVSNTRSITLADLDGRHGLDVIFVNRNEANLIYFNDGHGRFEKHETFGAASDATIKVVAADFDADGDLDIASANRKKQQNYIYLNNGNGSFASPTPYGTGSDSTRGITAADINRDGHMDILNANIREPNAIYFGEGNGEFHKSLQFGENNESYAVAAGDLNSDGLLDIAVGNARGTNWAYIQEPGGSFRPASFGAPTHSTYEIIVADWNADGRPEIATANSDARNGLFKWATLK